jgi:hypothetical protein
LNPEKRREGRFSSSAHGEVRTHPIESEERAIDDLHYPQDRL